MLNIATLTLPGSIVFVIHLNSLVNVVGEGRIFSRRRRVEVIRRVRRNWMLQLRECRWSRLLGHIILRPIIKMKLEQGIVAVAEYAPMNRQFDPSRIQLRRRRQYAVPQMHGRRRCSL